MDYTYELHQRGFRVTPQRLTILNILRDQGCHLSPLEIHHFASQAMPGLTEATVYRTLTWLAEQGLVRVAHIGNGQLVYEIADRDHHHIICRRCGDSREISHILLESLYEQLKAKTGFDIDCMHVTFFGLCPHCQANKTD